MTVEPSDLERACMRQAALRGEHDTFCDWGYCSNDAVGMARNVKDGTDRWLPICARCLENPPSGSAVDGYVSYEELTGEPLDELTRRWLLVSAEAYPE